VHASKGIEKEYKCQTWQENISNQQKNSKERQLLLPIPTQANLAKKIKEKKKKKNTASKFPVQGRME
jgi:hypothetical protein